MLIRRLSQGFLVLAVLALAMPMWAGPDMSMTQFKKRVDIFTQAELDGKMLGTGHYELIVDGSTAKFMQGQKIVAQAPCDWKTLPTKAPTDALVLSAKNELTEIEFSGKTQVLELH